MFYLSESSRVLHLYKLNVDYEHIRSGGAGRKITQKFVWKLLKVALNLFAIGQGVFGMNVLKKILILLKCNKIQKKTPCLLRNSSKYTKKK